MKTKATTRIRQLATISALLTACTVLTSCIGPRPLKGGKASTARVKSGAIQQSLVQGENPSQESRQEQQTIKLRSYIIPAGARVEQSGVQLMDQGCTATNVQSIILTAPMAITEREESRTATALGAAQKDTARELGAKLGSLRGITWVGLVLFLAGLASLVWPPLKAVIGSVTTSAAMMAGGLTLLVLPTLIAGNEILILGGVGLTGGAWFLAHRHGQLRGLLASAADAPNPNSPSSDSRSPEAENASTKN